MDSLIVAPGANLDVDHELQRLINTLRPTNVLLGSECTLLNLVDALKNQHYDLVFFLGHGTAAGIELADGSASSATIAQVLRGARVRCVFINTCESVYVAIRLHDEVRNAAVIATVGEVENDVATITGVLFAQHVADGASWREAYELSKRGDKYVYINDQMIGDDALALIEEIRQSSKRLEEIFHTEMLGVRSRLSDLERSRQPSLHRRAAWTVGFMVWSYVAYPLAYDGVRSWLELTDRAALLIAFFAMALAGILMMRAIEDI